MKSWVIVLSLFTAPTASQPDGLVLLPGLFTEEECGDVVGLLNGDAVAGVGRDKDHMNVVFGKADCISNYGGQH